MVLVAVCVMLNVIGENIPRRNYKKQKKKNPDNTIAKKTWNYLQNTAQKTTDNTNPI